MVALVAADWATSLIAETVLSVLISQTGAGSIEAAVIS
jgi:hypothetical protein